MKRLDVVSNAIRSVGYDAEKGHLEVEFHNGRRSLYRNVGMRMYRNFMNADSHGAFLHEKLRPYPEIYPHSALEPLKETMSKDEEATG